ncbi:MAG: bifunctional folylpolyglutamate synthase/dihydrofolate synthase, partial [Acidimicrobiia bacterium]|nr:bifunctional folylpolyglutamate synthase/dihydrofolate synthase [Acidimicrobiia bacterium]
MDYRDAVAYLDEHASYDSTGRIMSPSLEPITRLVSAMGEPQHAAPVIHVTGTNGKGSTAQMVTRLLMAQGLSVGTYTSPHLDRVNERISRDGVPIGDDEFAEQVAAIADLEGLTGVRPSYFEACTAAAFRYFADVAVDVAVIEVGLLGRWDATNVVDAQVAVVTNIAMDHNEFAGPTLADIAREKSGIIKPRSAAVLGELDPDLVAVLAEPPAATRLRRGIDFETAGNRLAVGGRLVDIRTPTTIYPDVFVPLHGAHQGDNASLALTAVEAFFAAPLSADVIEEGFGDVVLLGRFEVLGRQPLTIVDGAHNPRGADTCAHVFFDDFAPEGRRLLVIGTLRDPAAMLEALRADEFDVVIACTAPSPRGVPYNEIATAALALGCDEVLAADTVDEACHRALALAGGDDAVLATGSLYV